MISNKELKNVIIFWVFIIMANTSDTQWVSIFWLSLAAIKVVKYVYDGLKEGSKDKDNG